MNDYERVARVIRFLDEHHVEQPRLNDLAQEAGLSTFHFHRLFSKWAGVTPKDFLQCLTASHARQLLLTGKSALGAALDAGLSGPGRLHDLCVRLEAATPGELKARGAGCEVRYGVGTTPFGDCLAAETHRGVCHLAFLESRDTSAAFAEFQEAWCHARIIRDDNIADRLSSALFGKRDSPHEVNAFVRGTPFQVQVWRALLRVPPGALVTYGQVAQAIGAPGAARAVGSAVGSNALAFIIPCHRVIRETGIVGEYRWGRIRKRSMIAWESNPRLAAVAD